MSLSFKLLGVAFAAAVTLGASTAATASAQQGVLTADGPVTLNVAQTGAGNTSAFTMFGNVTRCPGSSYTGHKVDSTFESIPSGSSTATFTPKYVNCASMQGESVLPMTVDMNGCDYLVHIGATTGTGATYDATTDIVCPPSGHILVTMFSSSSHAFRLCTMTFGPQAGLTGAHFTDNGNGTITLKGVFTGIKATRSGLCGAATTETAEFHIDVTASATSVSGAATSISLSD